jgi:hypothetical protein
LAEAPGVIAELAFHVFQQVAWKTDDAFYMRLQPDGRLGTLFYGHELHKLKYSRLLRLLRLFLPRTWLESLCEKQRIRVHTTHPAYSSQECPEGHTIETDNRLFSMSVAGMRMFHRREMMR